MEGSVCTCMGNNMASLMGRETAIPARVSARPLSAHGIFFDCSFDKPLQGVSYFSQISRHAFIFGFVFLLDVSYHELGITVDSKLGDR